MAFDSARGGAHDGCMSTTGLSIAEPCQHLGEAKIRKVHRPGKGCEDCMPIGGRWVHLRECLTCGHVGCCDSSPNRHATAHYHATQHPIVTSLELGEDWVWCYADDRVL
jgi:uncharacterized UBP type Zn finger protein